MRPGLLPAQGFTKLTFQWTIDLPREGVGKMFSEHASVNIRPDAASKQAVFRVDAVLHRLKHYFQKHTLDLGGYRFRIRFGTQARKAVDVRNHRISDIKSIGRCRQSGGTRSRMDRPSIGVAIG